MYRDTFAGFIYKVAKGDKKHRVITTFIVPLIFFSLITFFMFACIWTDNWLALPILTGWWRYVIFAILERGTTTGQGGQIASKL